MRLLLIAVAASFLKFSAATCQENLSIVEKAILEYHNKLRRLHRNTPDLCYGKSDSTHTFYAQEWSEYCFPRGPRNAHHSRNLEKTNLGENIGWIRDIGVCPAEDYLRSIKNWYEEIFEYNFKNSGEQYTGRATQMIWKDTKELRCGRAAATARTGGIGVFIVCQYWPKGNNASELATMVNKFEEINDSEKRLIPEIEMDRILKTVLKQKEHEDFHRQGMEIKQNIIKRPEEMGNSDSEITFIVLGATLPCIAMLGLTIFCNVKRNRRRDYQILSHEDELKDSDM